MWGQRQSFASVRGCIQTPQKGCSKLDSILTWTPDSYGPSARGSEAREEADIKCPLAPPSAADCWIVHKQQAGRLATQLVMAGDVSGLEVSSS